MKILITGAKGYIGSRLKIFLEKNYIKNKITIVTKNNNITTKAYWENMPKVDLVIHLASKSNIGDSWHNTAKYINNNIIGTIRVLEYCKKNKAKVIFFSSYLYIGKKNKKSNETDSLKYNNPYALTKKNSEEWCSFYSKNFNIDICVLRLFNVYGKYQNTKFFIPSILSQLKKNKTIYINKKIYRDYLYIDDLTTLILKIIKNKNKINAYKIYNVGYGHAYNLFKIATFLKAISKSSSKIHNFNEVDKNQIFYTKSNISNISKTFKWTPKVDIYSGLKKILTR